ncbi:MAG: peptidylprolyl isomerase [Rhodothermales bacterium]|nr:peptidylprolyl isomerase [Rhodothermales bacterium]MBO6780011.1 peptidylprolyl isomerase [Rhodothermales bacterium]
MRVLLLPALISLGVLTAACGPEPEQTRFDQRPVAVANEDSVTAAEFTSSFVTFLIGTGLNDDLQTRRIHLENMIDAELLAQEARRRGLAGDSLGLLRADLERRRAVGARFFEEAFVETLPPPTEEEIRQTFARYKAQVVVRHLYFTDPDEARASWERLEEGEDFLVEAARVYGLADVDSAAGFLGPIRYFQMDDAFAEAAFELEPGAYSTPVRSRFGWHIIRAEDIWQSPLLTESEFQVRQGGLSSQFRLRRRRLEGDRFVRGFMESLEVQAEGPAITALGSMLRDLSPDPGPVAGPVLAPEVGDRIPASELRAMIEPSTPLATYRYRGAERAFTAADYLAWLPFLPFQEARNRTAASVGRALRNEVFYLEGLRRGLNDQEASIIVDDALTKWLASRMRDSLRANPIDPTAEQLRMALERLAPRADYSVLPEDSLRLLVAPAVAEVDLLTRLRQDASIRVDEALFDSLACWHGDC